MAEAGAWVITISEGSLCSEGTRRATCRRAVVSRTEKDALLLGAFDVTERYGQVLGAFGWIFTSPLSDLQNVTLFQGRIGGALRSRSWYTYSLTCVWYPPRPLYPWTFLNCSDTPFCVMAKVLKQDSDGPQPKAAGLPSVLPVFPLS